MLRGDDAPDELRRIEGEGPGSPGVCGSWEGVWACSELSKVMSGVLSSVGSMTGLSRERGVNGAVARLGREEGVDATPSPDFEGVNGVL